MTQLVEVPVVDKSATTPETWAAFTLLLGGVFLLVPVSSTRSPLPWDWSRMDWGVAVPAGTSHAQSGPALTCSAACWARCYSRPCQPEPVRTRPRPLARSPWFRTRNRLPRVR